jgi:23S rRNA (cytidine1920-2'-O)/16S rRNA (cytidine1409-2'-O)-methyltransferase
MARLQPQKNGAHYRNCRAYIDKYPDLRYAKYMKKVRLDVLMVERGLVESRQQAQRLVMAGEVFIGESRADKPAQAVLPDAPVHVRARLPFVSRGGLKLDAALKQFGLNVTEYVCADVGASTGGFTDCLLQHGAARVYAIDVGYGQLDWRLRQDARVVVMERVNARFLETLPEPIDLAVADVSFISLDIILAAVLNWLKDAGQIVALVKPQFEAGRAQVGKGGVVRDPAIHRQVLLKVLSWAMAHTLQPVGLIPSPITGPAGNVEFLVHLRQASGPDAPVESMIETCLAAVP